MADLSEFNEEAYDEELQKVIQRLQGQLSKAKRGHEEYVKAVYQAAYDAAIASPRPQIIKPAVDRRRKGNEVALYHSTDWQLGKETLSYNSQIGAERNDRFIQKGIAITEIQRADHPVKNAVIAYGGDMVEGSCIFPGQPYEIDSTLYEQMFNVVAIMERQIRTLAANYETVDVFTEYGNHGRIGFKGMYSRVDNMDLMCYRIAEGRTRDLTNVTWHISENWYNMIEVGNYSALLIHGDEIKSFGGQTPAFGILRKVTAWATGVVPGNWQDAYIGHFHQTITLPIPRGGRIFVTPSIESGSEYAREFVAAQGRPGQRLNFINPDKGDITSEYLIWLD